MARKTENILSLIENDHRKAEELFDQIETVKDSKRIQQLFGEIYKELTLHARTEELVFYPAMREYEETEGFIEEAEQEHNDSKVLLESMKSLKPSDSEFKALLQQLKESFLHHVEEEESEIFEAVQDCMDDKVLQQLGQEFQAAKSKLEPDVEAALI